MKTIKYFTEFKNFVWDPKRKPVDKVYMPDDKNKDLYIDAVRDEIDVLLDTIYKLGPHDSEKFQYIIWTTHLKEWQDILDDCLVNWDTPAQCAQRCVNKMKSYFNLT